MGIHPKFGFYEKVRIISTVPQAKKVSGEIAAVLGRAWDKQSNWSYTVHVYRDGICWSFGEEELEPTGEFDKRESFYTGEIVRIRVDEKGRGHITSD